MSNRDRYQGREAGVTILQFAIALPVLMILIFVIIDASRYGFRKSQLQSGAYQGVNKASKIYDFYWDVHTLPTNHPRRLAFNEARKQVIEAATAIPLSSGISDPETPSSVQLLAFDMQGYEVPGGDPSLKLKGAAVLRPFECAAIVGNDPFACSTTDPNCVSHPAVTGACPTDIEDSERLMKYHDIGVVLRARFHFFTPFMSPIIIEGKAFGRRNPLPHGRDITLPVVGAATTTTSTSTTTTVTTSSTTTTTVPSCDWEFSWQRCAERAATTPDIGPLCPDPNNVIPGLFGAPARCECTTNCPPPSGL